MLVADFHLDLAMNALTLNRDLRLPVTEIRRRESGMDGKGRGLGTVALPELRSGKVGLISATLWARVGHPGSVVGGYCDQLVAHGHAMGQFAYYEALARCGEMTIIRDRQELDTTIAAWTAYDASPDGDPPPVGAVIAIEGADPIVDPDEVDLWWQRGVRIVSLAHYGLSAYAHGTGQPGGLRGNAGALLRAMDSRGMILDLTHSADDTFFESLGHFGGPVLASHSNCRDLVPGDRQLTDDMIRRVIEREGVIGAAMDDWMLYPDWVKGETPSTVVSLRDYVNHIDHVCQVAGNARHAAIGTDLDGGYGREQSPGDLDTIADLQHVAAILGHRGYGGADIERIMWRNWVDLLHRAWPAA
ncbi:MAG: peptidase M19 [Chloroflexota bacterium]|nr:MAG: peptidase M19 [Chloroflexota bacterium]